MDEVIVVPRGPKRIRTSMWLDPFIYKPFLAKVKRQGFSTCHIIEPFMYAYTRGTPDFPVSPLPQVNVNLTVQRIVQRPRRSTGDLVPEYSLVTEGSLASCADCSEEPVVRVTIIVDRSHRREVYCCEDHFFRIRDGYKNIYWKDLKKFSWRRWKK